MKKLITIAFLIISIASFSQGDTIVHNLMKPLLAQRYNASGLVANTPAKIWADSVTLSGSSPYTVDISTASFSAITNIQATPMSSTSTLTSMPIILVKSYTTSTVTLTVLVSNSQTISILGTAVTGLANATSLTGTKIFLRVDGY